MNLTQLYLDYGVPIADEYHRHFRPGWVNTQCPYCTGNPGLHLGYNTYGNYFVCWRCGGHPITKTIAKLTNSNEETARSLIKGYGGTTIQIPREEKEKKEFRFPTDVSPLSSRHEQYLLDRGFDPDKLGKAWGLLGSGPISKLDRVEYKHRIIAPITWDGNIVSFQGRDITDRHLRKYKACPQEYEIIPHKEILYGDQRAWTSTGIIVEGITDVWRLGPASAATLGIKYTPRQRRWIANLFSRVFILFDDDPEAIEQAEKLKGELQYRRVETHIYNIVGDPGGMKQDDADHLVKQLI